MSVYEKMLLEKLGEAEPSLELTGADRKVFQIALQDFTNYLKFMAKAGEESHVGSKEKSLEIEAFVCVWSGMWLKKWKERFSLSIVQTPQKAPSSKNAETSAKAKADCLKLECREEVIEMVTMALIRNGEICGTNLLAPNIFEVAAGKIENQTSSASQSIAILNKSLSKAREISHRAGPLVKIQVDKLYYCPVNH